MSRHKKLEEKAVYGLLSLVVLVLLATVTFWGTFTLTIIVANALPIYGLARSCVPPVFSAFIAGLVVIYIVKEE